MNVPQSHISHVRNQLEGSYTTYTTIAHIAHQVPLTFQDFGSEFSQRLQAWQEEGGALDHIRWQEVGSFVLTATPDVAIHGKKLIPAVADCLGIEEHDREVDSSFISYVAAREDPDEGTSLAGAFAESSWAGASGYTPEELAGVMGNSLVRFSLVNSLPDTSLQGHTARQQLEMLDNRISAAPGAGHHIPRTLETMAYWLNLQAIGTALNNETTSVWHIDMDRPHAGQVPRSIIKDDWLGPVVSLSHEPETSTQVNRMALR